MPVDAQQGGKPCHLFHIATVDLDPGAVQTLERLGWLDKAKLASQMDVNEACTLLVRRALAAGLSLGGTGNVCARSGRCSLGCHVQVMGCLLYTCTGAPR